MSLSTGKMAVDALKSKELEELDFNVQGPKLQRNASGLSK